MTFDKYPGYQLDFKLKVPCQDASAHKFSLIYKFYSPVTKLIYILIADYHEYEVFGVKFYAKKDRHSESKYSRIINKGDLGNILITCAKIVPILLQDYPSASFGFIGSRTLDTKSKRLEQIEMNQRFRLYTYMVKKKIGEQTFTHFAYTDISGYLLLNKLGNNIHQREQEIIKMFRETYVYLDVV